MIPRAHYQDGWDQIVTDFVSSREPFKDYWMLSEQYALTTVDHRFVPSYPHRRMLDLGCGTGRLLARYSNRFQEVIAVEPDSERFKRARTFCKAHELKNVTLINAYFEDYDVDNLQFDLVLCGHVIQHLPVDSVPPILAKIRSSLANDGLLVVLTSFSQSKDDRFLLWSEKATQKEIQKDVFDSLVYEDKEQAYLPIRAFSRTSLRRLFADFKLRKIHHFHALHRRNFLDRLLFRDRWINWPLIRGRFGVDALLVLEKKI